MKKILIVEDQKIIAKDIENKLLELDYIVPAIISSGEEVIEAIKKTKPDLILMDIKLEGLMDGIEAAVEVRKKFDIPVVFVTSYSNNSTLKRAKEAEPYGYIVKPIDERDLISSIELALNRHTLEKKLKEKELQVSLVNKSTDEAVFVTDMQGKLIFMNDIAETLTGWDKNNAIGLPINQIINRKDNKLNLCNDSSAI